MVYVSFTNAVNATAIQVDFPQDFQIVLSRRRDLGRGFIDLEFELQKERIQFFEAGTNFGD